MSAVLLNEKEKNKRFNKLFHLILQEFCNAEYDPTEVKAKRIIQQSHPDVMVIDRGEEASLGIKRIQEIKRFVSYYPYEEAKKAVVFLNANDMTVDAQNALLKTLEDRSDSTLFYLGTESRKSLLPTVISRCSLVTVPDEETPELTVIEESAKEETPRKLSELTLTDTDELFKSADVNKKEIAMTLLREELAQQREALINHSDAITKEQATTNLKELQKLIMYVEKNVNPKLAIERYVISSN